MNCSDIKKQVYTYLGFKGVQPDGGVDCLISECLTELEKSAQFAYRYKFFEKFPAFLSKEPYASFLDGCTGVMLSVATLGAEVDKRIKYFGRTDMAKSVVLDACASAYLERLADEYEKSLGGNLTYRFCPGYGGSDISDIKYIFGLIQPEKIGVSLLDSNLMLPQKTMAGIVGVGKSAKKSCTGCFLMEHCEYRKEGARCYGSEKT